MTGIAIREAKEDDISAILEVLRAALGETPLLRRTREMWDWKHTHNPFGRSIVLVAESAGRIAGVRAFMRWSLATSSGTVLSCVRAVDTATHPEFARQGVFRSLTESAVEVARGQGIDLVFNTPNSRSAPGYFSLGWHQVGWIGAMVRPRLGSAVAAEDGTPPQVEDLLPGARPTPPTMLEDRPPRGLRTPRTEEYLTWRFGRHPTARYAWFGDEERGAAVRASVRRGRTETVVSDLLGGAGASTLRRLARNSRGRYAAAWFSRSSPERRAAVAAGFLPVPGLRALRLVARPLGEVDSAVLDLGSWDFAISDLELL